jgi:hypothetical protein
VTVSDQVGTAAPVVRIISATAADGERSSVRSNASVKTGNGFQTIGLALDVRPRLVSPTKVRVEIGLDTRAVKTEGTSKDVMSMPSSKVTQSVVLETGRAVLVSQTTDPFTDCKTTIEVKATILR